MEEKNKIPSPPVLTIDHPLSQHVEEQSPIHLEPSEGLNIQRGLIPLYQQPEESKTREPDPLYPSSPLSCPPYLCSPLPCPPNPHSPFYDWHSDAWEANIPSDANDNWTPPPTHDDDIQEWFDRHIDDTYNTPHANQVSHASSPPPYNLEDAKYRPAHFSSHVQTQPQLSPEDLMEWEWVTYPGFDPQMVALVQRPDNTDLRILLLDMPLKYFELFTKLNVDALAHKCTMLDDDAQICIHSNCCTFFELAIYLDREDYFSWLWKTLFYPSNESHMHQIADLLVRHDSLKLIQHINNYHYFSDRHKLSANCLMKLTTIDEYAEPTFNFFILLVFAALRHAKYSMASTIIQRFSLRISDYFETSTIWRTLWYANEDQYAMVRQTFQTEFHMSLLEILSCQPKFDKIIELFSNDLDDVQRPLSHLDDVQRPLSHLDDVQRPLSHPTSISICDLLTLWKTIYDECFPQLQSRKLIHFILCFL